MPYLSWNIWELRQAQSGDQPWDEETNDFGQPSHIWKQHHDRAHWLLHQEHHTPGEPKEEQQDQACGDPQSCSSCQMLQHWPKYFVINRLYASVQ